MKIRQDFVTNSSSTSFGAASATGILTAILSALGFSAVTAAAEAAAAVPVGGGGDAGTGSSPDRDLDPDALVNSASSYESKMAKLEKEIEQYQKEWEATKDTLEGADYEKTKQEYEAYIKYLGEKQQQAGEIEFAKQVEKITQEAEAEYKNEWLERQKDDLKNTKDQIEMIEATIAGYGEAGYEVSEAKSQLEMYKARERDLDKTLKKEGVDFNYQAKEREPIGPSKSVAEKIKEVDEKYEQVMAEIKKDTMDRKKKEIIQRNMDAWREESKANMKYANTADNYLKTAEAIQAGADIGVDALEKVTGPVGKTIKKAYVAGKGLGGGLGEAIADPSNASSHIAKGIVKGASDLGKEFTDSQLVKDGIGLVSETTQGAIDSYQKGESIASGIGGGLKKAAVDIAGDRLTDKFLPNSARDIDFGSYTGKEIFKGVVNGNPTIKDFIKDSVKDSLKNNVINQAKNLPKGEGFVFGDLKM